MVKILFEINIIGRVGKTSIINKYFKDKFDENEEMTVNSCYSQKELVINGKKFVFCIWVIYKIYNFIKKLLFYSNFDNIKETSFHKK